MLALDISNYSSHISLAAAQTWKAQGIGLVMIQLIAGVRCSGGDSATQIRTCLAAGLGVDCYLFPGNDGLGMTTNQRLALVPPEARVKIRQLWVDVEPASSLPARSSIDQALADCDAWAPWQEAGTYSALWVSSKMGWLPWPWPNRKQWLVYVLNSGAPNLGGSFSGTNNHVMTQYQMDVTVAGVSGMDRNLLSDAEALAVTRWTGGPMAITVGQGIADQMKANQDSPLCDHVNYDQTDDQGKKYQVEKCMGARGLYISSNSSGTWVNAGPLT